MENNLKQKELFMSEQINETPAIPEKFLNKEGKLNTDELLKSYLALEKKMSTPRQTQNGTIPNKAEDYKITPKDPLLLSDLIINKRLFELGLTNEQVQGVYDIAADFILPQLENFARQVGCDKELKALEDEFGGAEHFNNVARELSAWGEKNLDQKTFEILSSTKDGVLTLYRMMQEKQESPVIKGKSRLNPMDDEKTLRRLMQDPKYWKDQDPELVGRIEKGFKRLYG
jgi:hypothetical protein